MGATAKKPRKRAPASTAVAEPILKWAGGKRWAAKAFGDKLRAYLQSTPGATYIEPFVGAGAMALHIGPERGYLNDAIEPLVEVHRQVRDNHEALGWMVSGVCVGGVDRVAYEWVRDEWPKRGLDARQRAARFIFLNRLAYNGLYRENRAGGMNVPYGNQVYRESVVKRRSRDSLVSLFPNMEKLADASRALSGCEIKHGDCVDAIAVAKTGDIIYADPPYHDVYTAYTAEGFTDYDQARVAESLRAAADSGVVVVAHNSATDLTRELYAWADVLEVDEKRAVAARTDDNKRAPCLLICAGIDPRELMGAA